MLTLDLTNAPRWHDLAPGVRVQLRPLTTALMVATRRDAIVERLAADASDVERAVAFAKALARRAVLAWEGIGDADGNPAVATTERLNTAPNETEAAPGRAGSATGGAGEVIKQAAAAGAEA